MKSFREGESKGEREGVMNIARCIAYWTVVQYQRTLYTQRGLMTFTLYIYCSILYEQHYTISKKSPS